MKTDNVEVHFILDLNNLSSKCKPEFIAQFNAFVNKQKNKEVHTVMTTVILQNGYRMIHDAVDVKSIDALENGEVIPGYEVSVNDALCISLSKMMLRKHANPSSMEKSRTFLIVLTDDLQSTCAFYSEKEASDFIAYFKRTQSCEFYAFGISDGIKGYADKLGFTNAMVLKAIRANWLPEDEGEFSIEVPTFLRQPRNRIKDNR